MTAPPFPRTRVALLLSFITMVAISGCRPVSDAHEIDEPSVVDEIPGAEVSKVTLTMSAADRLGIETTTVAEDDGELSVPSAALIIDPQGGFWVYTNPEPLVYVRARLTDIHQEAQTTYFRSGPEPGTPVVTVGVPELYGTEYGIGH